MVLDGGKMCLIKCRCANADYGCGPSCTKNPNPRSGSKSDRSRHRGKKKLLVEKPLTIRIVAATCNLCANVETRRRWRRALHGLRFSYHALLFCWGNHTTATGKFWGNGVDRLLLLSFFFATPSQLGQKLSGRSQNR